MMPEDNFQHHMTTTTMTLKIV